MAYLRPNYLEPGFPVLSYTYALYCDREFSNEEFERWLKAQREGKDYRDYLNPYTFDARPFPMAAETLIAEKVATQGIHNLSTGRYRPSILQAWEIMPHIVAEVANKPIQALQRPAADIQPSRQAEPKPSAERPVLSCLACIFVGKDLQWREAPTAFLDKFALTPDVRYVLQAFGNSRDPWLSEGQAMAMGSSMVQELVAEPECW
jgi:hypothetical protein